ncbi:hypothetical protein BAUCODRAFT_267071 [Baudoinia panamericana UAMH 10762]|uniref:Uncharacterized protein n=1 Tax=Baudoinia panamericana (strain UAMH 10762) TaxID=717646 RepID=M2N2Q1_BAUPA|nr:uncharacterized protein BAUCODRAFT_267071 [Baudoinia panamericana UAMH 10762]EMC92940.1 hypothetical protein BAUCODRAFT_267071 [Baudoinia panamericana UAMH 10762]
MGNRAADADWLQRVPRAVRSTVCLDRLPYSCHLPLPCHNPGCCCSSKTTSAAE